MVVEMGEVEEAVGNYDVGGDVDVYIGIGRRDEVYDDDGDDEVIKRSG